MLIELAKALETSIREGTPVEWTGGHDELVHRLTAVMLDMPEKPAGSDLVFAQHRTYRRVFLVSGGMDSSILWFLHDEEPDRLGLFVNIGQPYADKERTALRTLGIPHLEVSYDLNIPYWQHIIPTRNFLFIALAEQYVADGGEIWIGSFDGESGERQGDTSANFYRMTEEFIRVSKNKAVSIRSVPAPSKIDWLRRYVERFGAGSIVHSVTCYSGTRGHCGRCLACVTRWVALQYSDIDTTKLFEIDPYVGGRVFIDRFRVTMTEALKREDFTYVSKERCIQTLGVIHQREGKQI